MKTSTLVILSILLSFGQLPENKDYRINDVQGLEGDALFEAIIGKEKGKVVLVDFWFTGCPPCRVANARFEPRKSAFDPEQVTFVYITTESASPLDTWLTMIPELSGEHYMLNNRQYSYLVQRLDVAVRGYPSYLILDRDGEKTFFQTGFPGARSLSRRINAALAN